ncbi:MAG: hypothetical protein A3J38_01395 [Gammaproteobacteria bacterium RIFCSPHIGHO2_12_FULL_45_9]|nr:MAG: hypothetical protein A3J38_01395 [Gammaproteobacteria bacterium RIFCSPHIGHO2_12_FULL_45_9]
MILPVIVYGNADLFRELFNGIAAALGEADYGHLMHLAILLSGIWAIMRYSAERNVMSMLKWLLYYYIACYIVLIPKVTILIEDRLHAGATAAEAVDHIPLGLAVIASATSHIGSGLTELMERNFSLPDDLRYSQTGLIMASQLALSMAAFQATDIDVKERLQQFIQQCIAYDVLLQTYSWKTLAESDDIWTWVSEHASPVRFVVTRDDQGVSHLETCQAYATQLTRAWPSITEGVAMTQTARWWPQAQQAHTLIQQRVYDAFSFLTRMEMHFDAIVKQGVMLNALLTHPWKQRHTIGNSLIAVLPLIQNIGEACLYGAFLFIFLLLFFPFGLQVGRRYVSALLCFQMWGPLYALLNLFMTFYAKMESSHVLHLSAYQAFLNRQSDIVDVTGYLACCVPFVAWGVTRGFSSLLSYATHALSNSLPHASPNLALMPTVQPSITESLSEMRPNTSITEHPVSDMPPHPPPASPSPSSSVPSHKMSHPTVSATQHASDAHLPYVQALSHINTHHDTEVLYQGADGISDMKVSGSRAWRDNNPGNLRPFNSTHLNEYEQHMGAIGIDHTHDPSGKGYTIFASEADGQHALSAWVDRHQDLSIQQMMQRYAPPGDHNQTQAYIDDVSRQVGEGQHTCIAKLSAHQKTMLMEAIVQHEGFRQGDKRNHLIV